MGRIRKIPSHFLNFVIRAKKSTRKNGCLNELLQIRTADPRLKRALLYLLS